MASYIDNIEILSGSSSERNEAIETPPRKKKVVWNSLGISEATEYIPYLSEGASLFKLHNELHRTNKEAYTPYFSEEACIFKVNEGLRRINPVAYTPMLISIGPYHHRNSKLSKMDKFKLLCLQSFLTTANLTRGECLMKLKDLKGRAENYYADDIALSGDEFVKMLLLDGCFVVEFVLRSNSINGFDPIPMVDWMKVQVVRDMLLLENQLPFFVLNELYQLIVGTTQHRAPFLNLVKFTFSDMLPKVRHFSLILTEVNGRGIKHLLQVVHKFCHPVNKLPGIYNGLHQLQASTRDPSIESCHIRSANELQEAGVHFKKVGNINGYSRDNTSLFDITFNHGILEIPSFNLSDSTETFLRNLIAYEQHSCDVYPKYFTAYAVFMDDLINTKKDVNLLRLNGIIINGLGDDKKVADLFSNLSKEVVYSSVDFYYADVCNELIQHCNKPWNVLMAKLRHDYFHTPWVGISTVAAILLLFLTAAQTIASFLGMHR